MRRITRIQVALVLVVFVSASIVACNRAGRTSTAPAVGVTSEATTAEATRITDATAPATHVWEQPTTMIKVKETLTVTPSTVDSADAKLVARGKGLYEKKGCNECHGDNAEGLPDKGSKLAGTELSEEEFEDILRTGGRGRLGNDHLYGTSAITSSGIRAIYAFLQSLVD